MFAAAEADLEPDILTAIVEKFAKVARLGTADVERKTRQQLVDQIGLTRAQLVALAPPEERTMRVRDPTILRRCIAIVGIARRGDHFSVWYSRCSSRAR